MEQVSVILQAVFILITFLTVWQFYRASNKSKPFLIFISVWMAIQFLLGQSGFFNHQNTFPPRAMLLIMPPTLFTVIFFLTPRGKTFTSQLNLKHLALIHTIRIPVEFVLYYLFVAKAIPAIMTFEGRNFDILAGLTAPFIYYFGFVKNKLSSKTIIIWNLISLGLLVNIVTIVVLCAKTPFQQFAFDEPDIAIGHFPFNWLPSVVVPIVFISHLSTLRQLINKTKQLKTNGVI